MPELICHYKKTASGWQMDVFTKDANGEGKSVSYPKSRSAGKRKELAILWLMKPGDEFTTITTWEDKNEKNNDLHELPVSTSFTGLDKCSRRRIVGL